MGEFRAQPPPNVPVTPCDLLYPGHGCTSPGPSSGSGVCGITLVQLSPQEAESGLVHSLALTPQDTFGCLLSSYKVLSCPWKKESLLGCPAVQQALRALSCRVPWPLSISPEAWGAATSHRLSCDSVSQTCSPAPFSGALMPIHSVTLCLVRLGHGAYVQGSR